MSTETESYRLKLNRLLAKRNHAEETIKEEKSRLRTAREKEGDTLEAQQHLQALAQAIQQRSHKQIAKIASRCLAAVFDEPYEMRIDFVRLRGKTEARLLYIKEGHEVEPLRTSGGVLDVSSLALRLSQLVLSMPQARKLLVLDEPFRGIDAKNLPKAAKLIETLSKEMEVQIVLVTHSETLEIGKVYSL